MKALKDLRIIFMGTPDFAVASLKKLIEENCRVVCVITAPDKPAGRGMQLQQSAVKQFALEKKLPLLQPEKLKDTLFLESLKNLQADIQVVVAFRMLPEVVWSMPPMGTLNLHGSLLPQYRGAAPINWAIINGEKITGLTTFLLQHEIDTGDILLQQQIPIGENENAGELYNRMKEAGADLLYQTLHSICNNTIIPKPQINNDELKKAPKLNTDTCLINWHQSTEAVFNLIRGLSPVPTAFTMLEGKKLKIFSAEKKYEGTDAPGHFRTDEKNYLQFACADGWIDVKELQIEGKKRMNITDFLRGYRFGNP